MAASDAEYYFRFRICWYRCLEKVKVYEQTKFCPHISIDGWGLTTSIFEKRTSAILEINFRFRFWPFARNLHIILHQSTEFRPNRSSHCGNMTSYPFLKMAAATAEYYFRFCISWCHCLNNNNNNNNGFWPLGAKIQRRFRRLKSISKPNFVEISQIAAEI